MGRKHVIAFFLSVALGFSCGGSNEDGGEPILELGESCAPSHPGDCPGGLCRDVVSGSSCDSISCTNWDLEANHGTICTKACSDDAECTGIDYAAVNDEQVGSENWSCSEDVCKVHVTEVDKPPNDPCAGCGGAFCSGPCIGCPQC